jgi:Rrf2 family transcriptional regulator, iron-sulfur cluster assembly transcription factor
MIYSVGCEYGIRALTKLAADVPPGRFSLLRDILEGIDLPQHFVGKIFQTLVRAEILVSAKGRGGGFALRRPPNEITLRQIVEAIDGTQRINRCILGFSVCNDDQACPQHDHWKGIRAQIDYLLDHTTLADLSQAMEEKKKILAQVTA